MSRKKKLHRVRCSRCGVVVGGDPRIKEIKVCLTCHKGKKKKDKAGPANAEEAYSRVKKGPAKDLPKEYQHYSFRSGWERNVARVLTAMGHKWEFESQRCTFLFRDVTRAPRMYICDFYNETSDEYWEVKGYFKSSDRSKIRRLKSQYPDVLKRLRLIVSKANKTAVNWYTYMDVKVILLEDLKEKWGDKVKWE